MRSYHALNRKQGRSVMSLKEGDYEALKYFFAEGLVSLSLRASFRISF